MIRHIVPIIEEIEPKPLLYTKQCRIYRNDDIKNTHNRRRIPILVSMIAKIKDTLEQEHRMARHVLNRYHVNFARPLVLSYLQYSN